MKKYQVTVEISVPDEPGDDDLFGFDPTIWMSSVFESAFVRIGGPSKHPYAPRVVAAQEIRPLSPAEHEVLQSWKNSEVAKVHEATRKALATALPKHRARR